MRATDRETAAGGVQLKETSGALENLQALHENIVESISGGLITTSFDGRITLVNPAAQELLNRREPELLGSSARDWFLDPLPSVEDERAHTEVRSAIPDSFQKTFRVIVSEMRVNGEAKGLVYTFDDLTEIRRLEREVRMQDKWRR